MNFFKQGVSFNPQQDIPALGGKVILVTGANIGLGKQCVLEYAKHKPAEIWLAARNLEKAQAALDEIQQQLPSPAPIKLLELDLSSLESVKKAAARVNSEADRLDILMLNAGVMAAPPGLTKDGHELQWGTNYLGHALLAKLLHPLLERTAAIPEADVRIIMVTSLGHGFAPKEGVRFETLNTTAEDLGAYERYGQSKLAMILWVRKMARLYPQFTISAIHPGLVMTNLATGATGSPFAIKWGLKLLKMVNFGTAVDNGAKNQLWASVTKDIKSGEYYEPVGVSGRVSDLGKNDELAEKVWEWTEKELATYVAS